MPVHVYLNDRLIEAVHFSEEQTAEPKRQKIVLDFKVTSEDYHDVAVLLYEMEFHVRVPEKNLDFQAAITNYSTSVTNLYLGNEVADYHLELTEKDEAARQ
ncbi:DUF3219 family protein [Planococcus chinensis]|uniref:DUF3219 family protein n=1 Tax=Planococcus chinensis TaxID=272917 RepID=A0ABW4QLJ4_9BACL